MSIDGKWPAGESLKHEYTHVFLGLTRRKGYNVSAFMNFAPY